MSDSIKTIPNPIQRNEIDAAIELTQMYFSENQLDLAEMKKVYTEFYSLVKAIHYCSYKSLKEYLPENYKSIIKD